VRTLLVAARVVGIGVSIAIGLILIALAAAVGDCGFAGGRCPSEAPPLLHDDTFGTAAFGAALLVGVPVFLSRPSWRRLAIAVAAAIGAGVLVGLVVRSSANS
jgi:hypothetical protein